MLREEPDRQIEVQLRHLDVEHQLLQPPRNRKELRAMVAIHDEGLCASRAIFEVLLC